MAIFTQKLNGCGFNLENIIDKPKYCENMKSKLGSIPN